MFRPGTSGVWRLCPKHKDDDSSYKWESNEHYSIFITLCSKSPFVSSRHNGCPSGPQLESLSTSRPDGLAQQY